uniref:Uncharacterized protein n=1 Tax=Anopheles arabiensis TaxID=7173 RepID=A0A182IHH4_ANOAR
PLRYRLALPSAVVRLLGGGLVALAASSVLQLLLRHRPAAGRRRQRAPRTGCRRVGQRGHRDVVLPGAAAGQMPPLEKLVIVHHPERAEVVLVPDEALVQRQVGAYRVLHQLKKREEEDGWGGEEEKEEREKPTQ